MAKICLCLTANTIERDLEILDKYHDCADIAELRVDCLDPDERLAIRNFPRLASLPVILTIRRDIDGGRFNGGEGARVRLMAYGLAYAEADSRQNFAYVDIEDDLDVPSLEEAARTFGTRIIRSYHNIQGIDDDIPARIKSMVRGGDELVKVVLKVTSSSDVLKVLNASKACQRQEKILICTGHYGVYSRILAESFGSLISFTSPFAEGELAAPDQLDTRELAELYRFRSISKNTRIYGVMGYPLKSTVSPLFYNTAFGLENTDAVYVPFPTDSIENFMELAAELEVQGLSVNAPYKEAILPWLSERSDMVHSIGSCNTLRRVSNGWLGENTDVPAFSDSLLEFAGKKDLRRKKVTIIGAGGAARAAAAEVHRLGGKALILNRTVYKARAIASLYNFRWEALDSRGKDLISKYSDIIIQATSVGMEGSEPGDPLEDYKFTGRENVVDFIYRPKVTPMLKRAENAGCRTMNGYDMVIRQACLQYAMFMDRDIPGQILPRIKAGGEVIYGTN